MHLIINGESRQFEPRQIESLTSLMRALEIKEATGTAVAVNDEVIPRGQWQTHTLRPGDRVEVIRATSGG